MQNDLGDLISQIHNFQKIMMMLFLFKEDIHGWG